MLMVAAKQFRPQSSEARTNRMTNSDTWSPDEPQGSETFEASDESLDEEDRLDPGFAEAVQMDPSLDPSSQLDQLEMAEAGLELDDPEQMATLPGGGDDPDGIGEAPSRGRSWRSRVDDSASE